MTFSSLVSINPRYLVLLCSFLWSIMGNCVAFSDILVLPFYNMYLAAKGRNL